MKKVGVTLAAENKEGFLAAMKAAENAVADFNKTVAKAASASSGISSATKAAAASSNIFKTAATGAANAAGSMAVKMAQSAVAYDKARLSIAQAEQAVQKYRQAQQQAAEALAQHTALGTDATGMALKEASANEQAAKAAAQIALARANVAVSTSELKQAQVTATSSTQELTTSQERSATAFQNVERSVSPAKGALEAAGNAMKAVAEHVAAMASKVASVTFHAITDGAMAAARAAAQLGEAALKAAAGGIAAIGRAAMDAGSRLLELGAHLVETGIKAAAAFTGSSIKASLEFSQKMSEVAAVSGATREELAQMTDQALELGAKFPVSASDAADAMGELAKAGFTAKQSIEASSGVVQLASATHMNMAQSSTILANAINGFGLEAKDASRVTDLLAQTANASAVDVSDLGQTFKYAAPAAKAAGFSIEDVSKVIGIMGNAGIKGSQAGTTLNNVIARMAAPTKDSAAAMETLGLKLTDTNGKIRPLNDIMLELRAKFKQLSQVDQIDLAKKLAGQNSFNGLLAAVTASDDAWNQMSDAIDSASGAGERMAQQMNDNLAGAIENLKGSIETLKIKLGRSLETPLKNATNAAAGLVNVMTGVLDKAIKSVSTAVDAFKIAVEGGFTVGPKVSGMAATFSRLGEAVKPLVDAVKGFIQVLRIGEPTYDEFGNKIEKAGKAASGAHPVIDAIAKLVNNVLVPAFDKAAYSVLAFHDRFGPLLEKVQPVVSKFLDLYNTISPLKIAFDTLSGFMTGGLYGAFDGLATHVTKLGDTFGINLRPAVAAVESVLGTNLSQAFDKVISIGKQMEPTLIKIGQAAMDAGKSLLSIVLPAARLVGGLAEVVLKSGLVEFALNQVSAIAKTIAGVIDSLASGVKTNMDGIVRAVKSWEEAFNSVRATVSEVISYVADFISTHMGTISSIFEKAGSMVKTAADGIGTAFRNLEPAISKILDVVLQLADSGLSVLNGWWGILAFSIGDVAKALNMLLGPAIDVIVAAINEAIKAINQMVDVFDAIAGPMNIHVDKLHEIKLATDQAADAAVSGGSDWDSYSGSVQGATSALTTYNDTIRQSSAEMNDAQSKLNTMDGMIKGMTPDVQSLWAEWKNYSDKAAEGGVNTDMWTSKAAAAQAQLVALNPKLADVTAAYDIQKNKLQEATSAYQDNTVAASLAEGKQRDLAAANGGTSDSFNTLSSDTNNSTSALQTYNATPVQSKTAVTNFANVLSGVNSVIDALIRYNNTPVSAKNAAAPSAYASGTSYHKGGPAWIGEGGQPELLTTRRGATLITSPTFFSNLEAGAAVKPLSWSDLAGATTRNQAVDRTSGMGLPNFSSAGNLGKALAMDAGRSVGSGLVAGIEAGLTGSTNGIQNEIGNLAKSVADKLGTGLVGGITDVINRSKQSLQSVVDNVAGQLGGGGSGGSGGSRSGGGGSGPSNPEINNAIKDLVSGISAKSSVSAIPSTSQINNAFNQLAGGFSTNNTKNYNFNLTSGQGLPTQGQLQSTIGIAKALTF